MVSSIAASVRFYVDGLGFEIAHTWTPNGRLEWCWLQRGGAAVMLQEYRDGRRPEGPLGLGVSICFQCHDAIAFYKEAVGRGLQPRRPFVGNNMWVTTVSDPDGYQLLFESVTDAPEEREWSEADA